MMLRCVAATCRTPGRMHRTPPCMQHWNPRLHASRGCAGCDSVGSSTSPIARPMYHQPLKELITTERAAVERETQWSRLPLPTLLTRTRFSTTSGAQRGAARRVCM